MRFSGFGLFDRRIIERSWGDLKSPTAIWQILDKRHLNSLFVSQIQSFGKSWLQTRALQAFRTHDKYTVDPPHPPP